MIKTAAVAIMALVASCASAPAQQFVTIVPAEAPASIFLPSGDEIVFYSEAEELRKAIVRAASGYRDPNRREVCPSPWRMSDLKGCH